MILGGSITGKGGASELRYVEDRAESDACLNFSREKRWGLIVAEGTSRCLEGVVSSFGAGGSSVTSLWTGSCIGPSSFSSATSVGSVGAGSSRNDRLESLLSSRRLSRSRGGIGLCVLSPADVEGFVGASTILCLLRDTGLARSSFHFFIA
jgi:hypothetical protein